MAEGSSSEKSVNIVLIGDGYVGKTSILKASKKSESDSNEYSDANLYDEAVVEAIINNNKVNFTLIDTAGQEEYDILRKSAYEKANMFILCFCVADKVSFDNIKARWVSEIQAYKHIPIILVGTKLDLRESTPQAQSVTRSRGLALQRQIGAKLYVECSSKTGEGMDEILNGAVSILNTPRSRSRCILQ